MIGLPAPESAGTGPYFKYTARPEEGVETPAVAHADILAFAEDHVNLPRDSARRYREQVNNLRENLARHIKENPGFGLVKMLHSGSVAKGTALRTINDLDVAVYVKKEQVPVDEKKVVGWMEGCLREAYPNKDRGDFACLDHCVRINFRGTGLDVDVVPVIYEGGDDDRGYLVDKHTGQRLHTSIPLHLEFMRRRKGKDPNFAQVARLAKWWAKQRKDENPGFKCKSFLLELLLAHLSDLGAKMNDYPQALETLFNYVVRTGLEERVSFDDYYASDALPGPTGAAIEVLDPVNADNNVTGGYSDGDRDALVGAAEEAADAIREALYATTKGRAVERWQAVLGESFRG